MARVSDKIAFVTGAAAGIGRATCLALAREGAHIVATDIDLAGAETVASEVRALGRRAIAIRHDAGVEAEWRAAVARTLQEFGTLDILVNNAGVGPSKPLLETTLADWHAVTRINLDGVFLGIRLGVEAMRATPERPRKEAGSIINLSSILGLVGMAETAAYSASKGGVRLLTKSTALECAEKGYQVRVNSVHPGFTWTPMVQAAVKRMATPEADESAIRQALTSLHPLGRMGEAEDIAAAIVFLASNESAFVTGAELVVDGGYTAR
jgi:NAD(P)-dependent dehydrogenase (short-subunit alcohol dehydrogenase family)